MRTDRLEAESAFMDAAEIRLLGALIGLARATDGNTVRTEETGRLMRAGLAALTAPTRGKTALSERAADGETESGIALNLLKVEDDPEEWEKRKEQKELCETLTEKIHAEKRILAPDCATCGAPCGKTADYDINQWKKEKEPVQEQKMLLLDRLIEVAAACAAPGAAASAAPDLNCAESSERGKMEPQVGDSAEIDYFLTKSLFALGESWEAEWIAALVKEADGYLVSRKDY